MDYRKPYRQLPDLQQRLSALRETIVFLRDSNLPPDVKRPLLGHALWQITRAHGDLYGEFRSHGFLNQKSDTKVQREHVFRRELLIEAILRDEEPLGTVLDRVIHCSVSKDEHKRLHDIHDKRLDGWARYVAAEIEVYSCRDEVPERVWL